MARCFRRATRGRADVLACWMAHAHRARPCGCCLHGVVALRDGHRHGPLCGRHGLRCQGRLRRGGSIRDCEGSPSGGLTRSPVSAGPRYRAHVGHSLGLSGGISCLATHATVGTAISSIERTGTWKMEVRGNTKAELSSVEQQLAALSRPTPPRPVKTVQEALAAERVPASVWQDSQECAKIQDSTYFMRACAQVVQLRKELAAARDYERLSLRATELRQGVPRPQSLRQPIRCRRHSVPRGRTGGNQCSACR